MNGDARRFLRHLSLLLATGVLLLSFAGAARGQTCGDERFVVELNALIYGDTSQPYSFVAIHLEHYNTKSEHAQSFDALKTLVDKIDNENLQIPLTIMFHQSWIDWLKDTGPGGGDEHADTVKGWFASGREGPVHEPGIHNHGPAHTFQSQSGWTEWEVFGDPSESKAQDLNDHFVATIRNCPSHPSCYDYLATPVPYPAVEGTQGFIRDVQEEIEMFLNLTAGDIVSGTVMVPWHEAPETYAVSQRKGNSGRNHRLPNVTAFNGQASHDQYLFIGEQFPAKFEPDDDDQAKLKMQVEALWTDDFGGLEPENIYGLVFHAHNYKPTGVQAGARCNINVWLETLNAIDLGNSKGKRKTMRAIMEDVVFPTDYSYDGFKGDGFCDALEACGDGVNGSGEGGACEPQDIQDANPYDEDLNGTFPNWGMPTHTSPLDCGRTGEGNNLNASATGQGTTLRHAGRAYQAEGSLVISDESSAITTPSGAQGGEAVQLDNTNPEIDYDVKDEEFTDFLGNPIENWQVSIRSRKVNSVGDPPEVTISTRESNSGAWAVECTDVQLSADTNWDESDWCPVSWSQSAANRQLQIKRESAGAHIDAVLLRPDLQ